MIHEDVLVYYALGHRAANFRWFAKSLATLRAHYAGPVAVLCDRKMTVSSPDVTVYPLSCPTVLDAMIARARILEFLPRTPATLLYLDTDTTVNHPLELLLDACAAPGFWATLEPKGACFIGSPVSGECSLTASELADARRNRQGSACSGVLLVDRATAGRVFPLWVAETAAMAARFPALVAAADWRTGDQASLNALVYRKKIQVNPFPWELVRQFAPPWRWYKEGRHPVVCHFSGSAPVKAAQATYPGDPVLLSFPDGDNPLTKEIPAA